MASTSHEPIDLAHRQDDVTSHAGFGSWLSTFAPAQTPTQPVPNPIELPADPSAFIAELDAGSVVRRKEITELEDSTPRGPIPIPVPIPEPAAKEKQPIRETTPIPSVPDPVVRLRIDGLRNPNNEAITSAEFNVSLFSSLSDVNDLLIRESYEAVVGFSSTQQGDGPKKTKALPLLHDFPQSWPVLVTSGPSCYDLDSGLRINEVERFGTFISRLQVHVRCIDSYLSINNGDLIIGFHRTLRVPEDGSTHLLPADFGLFPLANVASYDAKLRKSGNLSLIDMANKAGVFFPTYQREAMWISFRSPSNSKYAIRVFVGGVNAVSGKAWNAPKVGRQQDYVVVPPQEQLNGIAVGRDKVGQFVAMPIGSGYSVEKQITGKENIGGLQLEITPSGGSLLFEGDSSKGSSSTTPLLFGGQKPVFGQDPEKCPRDAGFASGTDILLMRDGNGAVTISGKKSKPRPYLLRELLGNTSKSETVRSLTALYHVKLSVIVPSRFSSNRFTTNKFSPFTQIDEVARETEYRDSNLVGWTLLHGKHKADLDGTASLVNAGLVDYPVIIARQPTSKSPKGDLSCSPKCLGGCLCCIFCAPVYFYLRSRKAMQESAPALAPYGSTTTHYHPQSYSIKMDQVGRPPSYYAPAGYNRPTIAEVAGEGRSKVQPVAGYGTPLQQFYSPEPASQQQRPISSQQRAEVYGFTQDYGSAPQTSTNDAGPSHSARPPSPPIESWTMGLAAGGMLRQQIHPDPDKHRSIWNYSGTCLVSVQLLNVIVYESLTGKVAPPTPITPEAYVAAGIPFYDTYTDRIEGVGDVAPFEYIKNVTQIDTERGIARGTDITVSARVACSICERYLCDCILRPCNHAFCSTCVYTKMARRQNIVCQRCNTDVKDVVRFAAPMGMPGEENIVDKDMPVVVLPALPWKHSFTSIAELP